MTDYQFRNAMFGGFNRQDVLNFLTSSAEKNNEELAARQERCEELEKELERCREEVAALKARLGQTAEEREELRHQTEQLTVENARISAADQAKSVELEKKREELSALRGEVGRLSGLLTKIAPDAEAYAAIKERTAGMELEAHRRAQNVESRAKIMAGDLQRQMEQWVAKVEKQYSDLRAEVEASVEQANQQIQAAGGSLNRVNELLAEQQNALKSVVDSYADSVRGKKAE
jgi:chromosome segregation ATPase